MNMMMTESSIATSAVILFNYISQQQNYVIFDVCIFICCFLARLHKAIDTFGYNFQPRLNLA